MILMVYNRRQCREFLLPNLRNADYEILLPWQEYGLTRRGPICLEVTKKGWVLDSTEDYQVRKNGQDVLNCLLKDQDILELRLVDGNSVKVIVADADLSFIITRKYDLSGMSQVSIGKTDGNIIRYDFRDLISGCHAELIRHSDGWYLTDRSSNGVFCGEGRIQGSRRLDFFEHLNIFGLHLVFLGDILAVGTYYGSLSVREDILKRKSFGENENTGTDRAEAEQNAVRDAGRERIRNEEPEYFNRSPRDLPSLYTEPVEIEGPPAPKDLKQRPWFLVVGPSFTMAIPMLLGCGLAIWGSSMRGMASGAFMYTGLITAVGSAALGAFWAMTNMKYSRAEQQEDEEHRFNAYSNYLVRMTESLEQKYEYNGSVMRQMYPSARTCASYGKDSAQLWNRNHTHGDFLFQRLGIGEVPFQTEIIVPKEKFTLQNDSLLKKPQMIREQFRILRQVPVGISLLKKQLVGLVGGKGKKGSVEMMHSIVAGLAAAHCYTDVKFVFLYDGQKERESAWECMRWFPHVWSEDRQTRYMAADEVERRDILFALSNILRARMQSGEGGRKKGIPKPYYILFISDPGLLEDELLARYVYEPAPEYGFTTFLMTESVEQLPNACEDIIENDGHFQGFYNLLEGQMERKPVQLDKVSEEDLERMGRTLADIQVNETETTSEIPTTLDFFSMYGVKRLEEFQVAERWKKNRTYNSMKALIGKKSGNMDCCLDVHEKYHGPHGLVAGTTGSGKSETLQTYILSLALNFSPEDVSFFIIDFKGGGMANLFSDLPHMAGQISNLSGNQIRRAMISIKSENLRRQRIFTEYGVNNINLYTRLYKSGEAKEPVPHLFIIIDEFAELKKEEPDFMRELISVAQVGRSLGVHLILATQKPSGTVDDNIWSNSRFRLCLRVQDRQDSNDMLRRPDAAFITQTGRGYLQVGNDEIYELFQSGWSGAPYEEDTDGSETAAVMLTRTGKESLAVSRMRRFRKEAGRVGAPGKTEEKTRDITQLEALVEYLKNVAGQEGYRKAGQLWMPVLGEEIFLDSVRKQFEEERHSQEDGRKKWSLKVPVGIYDDPERQRQAPFVVDLAEGGDLAVCGSVVSGKSTFLQTMLYSLITTYSPDVLQCYILDFSSRMLAPFENAPHVGGIIYDNQEDRLGKFMHMLDTLMEERRKRFQGGNFSQYIQAYGQKLSALLVVIDNFAGFREKSGGRYDDAVLRLVREGTGYGIYLAVTSAGYGISEIPGRIADNIRTSIALEQGDKYKYMEIMRATRLPVLPEAGVKGRGLAEIQGRILEFQTALAKEAEDDFARGRAIEEECRRISAEWKGKRPAPIPEIPENPTLGQLEKNEDYQKMIREGRRLPFAYDMETAAVFGIGLKETYCYTISGRAHTGKTNVLRLLIHAAKAMGGELHVIELGQEELKKTAEACGAGYYSEIEEIFGFFKKLTPIFVERNRKKRALFSEGMDEDEIYGRMAEEEPVFIFLGDLKLFFGAVYKADASVGNMSGFMENIMEKGSLHRIYFLGCLKTEDTSSLAAYKAYKSFVSYKKGVHLGGNLSAQKVFSFQNIPYAELGKTMKKGGGYAADEEDETAGIRIAIPLARRELP